MFKIRVCVRVCARVRVCVRLSLFLLSLQNPNLGAGARRENPKGAQAGAAVVVAVAAGLCFYLIDPDDSSRDVLTRKGKEGTGQTQQTQP